MNGKQARLFFLVLLVASLLLLVFVDVPGSAIGPNFVEQERDIWATMLIVAQITAPVISLMGLITTTYFTWRKDRREQIRQESELRNESSQDPPILHGSTKPDPLDSTGNEMASVENQTHVSN